MSGELDTGLKEKMRPLPNQVADNQAYNLENEWLAYLMGSQKAKKPTVPKTPKKEIQVSAKQRKAVLNGD